MARTEHGSLRGVLRKWIDQSEGVIQLVGTCHGAEPHEPDAEFGRVSYTQFEALYARKCGKPVWYFFVGEGFIADAHEPEPEELLALQRAYRERIREANDVRHTFRNDAELENCIHRLRDDLTKLRHGEKRLTVLILVLLTLIVAGVVWSLKSVADTQKKTTRTETKVDALPQAVTEAIQRISAENAASGGKDNAMRRTLLFAELEKKYGLTAGTLATELPEMARKRAEDAAIPKVDRAKAALAALDYADAERLALEAYAETKKAVPLDKHKLIDALVLAGRSASAHREDKIALTHLTEASKLTDKTADALEWANVNHVLSHVLLDSGAYGQAERLLREVIAIRTEKLGAEHPDTLQSRHNLAAALQTQGKNAEAEQGYRAVLKIMQRVLGAEHPITLGSRNNLALALWAQGKHTEAEKEHRAVLAVLERVLGAEHPDTLGSRNNLAAALQAQGKNAEAEKEFRAVLAVKERVLGAQHPSTLNSRNNLAAALQAQGKNADVEREHRAVLAIRERILGAEHPDTLQSRANLAAALDSQGKHVEAEREHRACIEIEQRVLGMEHPDVFESCYNLALCLEAQKKLKEALTFVQCAEAGWLKVLGPEHQKTKLAKRNRERIEAELKRQQAGRK